jgi:endonuclease YncB( thermonuclease family)
VGRLERRTTMRARNVARSALFAALSLGCILRVAAEPIHPNEIEVVDGDTIRARGVTLVRLVGFDAPETWRAKCPAERSLGTRATERLRQLVASGPLDLTEVVCSCRPGTHGTKKCNHGRECGTLTVRGKDVGEILIAEGLARPFVCGVTSCPRQESWCSGVQ